VNVHLRRGTCPGLSQPMATGDGLLVRLTPTGTTISCEAFSALCTAARNCGNGVIEITSRGSIQIRGLTDASVKRFAAAIAAIEVAFCEGPPVLSNSLAGLDPDEALDITAIAADLRRVIAAASFAADIGPKVSIAIDGGGALHLDAVTADVRLRAQASGAYLHVAVAGDAEAATPIGTVATEHGVEAVMRILRVMAAGGPAARARDIVATNGAATFSRLISDILVDLPRPPRQPVADPFSTHALRDGRMAIGLGLAFGHAHSTALEKLARAAMDSGAAGLRTAPGHALLVVGVTRDGAGRLADIAERLGFIVRAEDPRRQVVACAGAPICAAAEIPTRALAPGIAAKSAIAGTGAPMVHVSGCAKGCACPRSMPLTVVGIEGRCGVVVNGSARDQPLMMLMPEALPSALSRLADAVRHLRVGDEGAAEVLSRLDRAQIVRLILGEATDA
jgi:precorrin-3B synthase